MNDSRELSWRDAAGLRPGDEHRRSYVGPPSQFDLMGASQFSLLVASGLRSHHRVLDFGCGSLRLGRLLLPYLQPGGYVGLDPNGWLIDETVEKDLSEEFIKQRQPTFIKKRHFRADRCGSDFDFIVAQSIFSHTGPDMTAIGLDGIRCALAPSGLGLVTFAPGGAPRVSPRDCSGWVYPETVGYPEDEVSALFAEAGLEFRRLNWIHPRQTWFAVALSQDVLPSPRQAARQGDMAGSPEFNPSS